MSRYVHVNVQGCPDDNPYARVMCARVALRKYCFGIYTRVTRTRSSRLVSERDTLENIPVAKVGAKTTSPYPHAYRPTRRG